MSSWQQRRRCSPSQTWWGVPRSWLATHRCANYGASDHHSCASGPQRCPCRGRCHTALSPATTVKLSHAGVTAAWRSQAQRHPPPLRPPCHQADLESPHQLHHRGGMRTAARSCEWQRRRQTRLALGGGATAPAQQGSGAVTTTSQNFYLPLAASCRGTEPTMGLHQGLGRASSRCGWTLGQAIPSHPRRGSQWLLPKHRFRCQLALVCGL